VHIAGENFTEATVAIAHNHLLLVDLLYGCHDGVGLFDLSKELFLKGGEEWTSLRLFRWLLLCRPHSPNGNLATYRFQAMDPGGLGAMAYDPPAADGSSCRVMAESLRGLLRREFEAVLEVHSGQLVRSREVFRRDLEANWGWLDGSLL